MGQMRYPANTTAKYFIPLASVTMPMPTFV
jgi:hypothetical protein